MSLYFFAYQTKTIIVFDRRLENIVLSTIYDKNSSLLKSSDDFRAYGTQAV